MIGITNLMRSACLIVLLAIPSSGVTAGESEYLSAGELVGLGSGSMLVYGSGLYVKHRSVDKSARWVKPPGFDEKISRFFGRTAGINKQNPIDSDFGSAITTLVTGVALGLTDYDHPRSDRNKDLWQGQLVFYSGALATKGVTDFFKGTFARQRPLLYFEPELAATRTNPNYADDNHSFFSGHASSAFYAMTFLNLRIREVMRQEMSADEYRSRRWLPSTLCLGWASYVAFSRVQAYKHYATDVIAGALVGYLLGELYYSLSKSAPDSTDDPGSPLYLQIHIGI